MRITPAVRDPLRRPYAHHRRGDLPQRHRCNRGSAELPTGAVDDSLAAKVFKASGSKKQIVGVVKALNKPIG